MHVLEEAPGFTVWARRHASERYTERDSVCNNAVGMVLTVSATAAVRRSGSRPLFLGWYTGVLTAKAHGRCRVHAKATAGPSAPRR